MTMPRELLLACLLLVWIHQTSATLDNSLAYYETLHHEFISHSVKRRSVNGEMLDEGKHVEFDSHGKHFSLHLSPDSSLFTDDFRIVSIDSKSRRSVVDFVPKIYRGYLADEPNTSTVSAYWDGDKTFTASIKTDSETYFVEPSWRHLPASANYSMIAYRASDIRHGDPTRSMCGHKDAAEPPRLDRERRAVLQDGVGLNPEEDYCNTECINRGTREGRAYTNPRGSSGSTAGSCSVPTDKKICSLLLVADHKFHEKMGFGDRAKTANYLIGVIDWIDRMFRSQRFGDCGSGFGFQINEIRIHETATEGHPMHYNTRNIKWNVSALLESFGSPAYSQVNYESFCLAHLFTAQSFDTSVLGYSNVAEANEKSIGGGICSQYAFKKRDTYVNTGWTTVINSKDERVVSLQAKLVTAHELGHNWGSFHDADECYSTAAANGRYLMHMYSVSGIEPNNKLFSPCSRSTIAAVLSAKASLCFTKESGMHCGNSRLDLGLGRGGEREECDEGQEQAGNTPGKCCHKCKLLSDAKCSDANHECCINCQYAPATTECQSRTLQDGDSLCRIKSYCTGNSSQCPPPVNAEDGSQCLEGSHKSKCRDGKCLSLCEYHNKISCVCRELDLACEWCCRDDVNATCEPFYKHGNLSDADKLPDDWPCDLGYCEKGKCVQRGSNTFQRLWSIIEFKSVGQFVKFMHNNIVGTVIVMSLIIWIPASCVVSYIDRKREREEEENLKWLQRDNVSLIHEQSNVRIKTPSRGPKERKSLIMNVPQ